MSTEEIHVEALRQRTLAALEILDTAPEEEFDAIVRAARRIFGCRTSYISLIDTRRQWFKARENFDPDQIARECSLCAVAVEQDREIVVDDLQAHRVFGARAEIAAMPELRFFATIPLKGPEIDGARAAIGTLCVSDDTPRVATGSELAELRQLALVIESLFRTRLDARLANSALVKRKDLFEEMRRTQRQFELAEQMAQIGHWRLDLATDEVFWSKQTCEIHGVDFADEKVLASALEFFLPHDRARLNQYLDDLLENARKARTGMALLLIDLDYFKEVNDRFGHEAGDHVLTDVAAQLVSEPFTGQFCARLGGDEFVMVIENADLLADLEGALSALLGRLRFEVVREGEPLIVSATIGATWLTENNNERSALLRCADHALYQAKRAERGTASICPDAIAGDRVRAKPHLRAVG